MREVTLPVKIIVTGQKVTAEKKQRSKELRQSMTQAEGMVWPRVRAHQLGGLHFRRQQVIAGFIVDFYCHAASLVVELDGTVHEFQVMDDLERDRMLKEMGLRVLRIPNQEVFDNVEAVLDRIQKACAR